MIPKANEADHSQNEVAIFQRTLDLNLHSKSPANAGKLNSDGNLAAISYSDNKQVYIVNPNTNLVVFNSKIQTEKVKGEE